MTPEAAASNSQSTRPVAAPSRPVARAKRIEKYPVKFQYSISIPMAESLQRLTSGPAGLLREVDVGRLALHAYLLANDPQYAHAMRGGNA